MKKVIPALLFFLALPLLMQWQALEILKLKTFDALVQKQEPTGYFAVLDLDEEFINNEGGYPLPRSRLAEIHVDILRAGAMGVGWAFTFPQADRMGGDLEFSQALSFAPTVLAMFENDNGSYPPAVGTVILGDDQGNGFLARGVVENIELLKLNANQGIASAPTDVDGLVRQIPLLLRTPDGFAPSFALEIIKILTEQDTYIIKTNENGLEEITVKGLPPISVDLLGRKWVSYVATPTVTLKDLDVKDKFVIVGTSGGGIMPQVATSDGLKRPHYLQAALAESILLPNSPQIPNWHLSIELIIFLIIGFTAWLLTSFLGMTLGLVSNITIMSGTAVIGVWMIKRGLLIDVTWTIISHFIIGATAYYLKFREQYKLRQQIKKQFGTYLSPDMVQMLQEDPSLLKLGGERKEMSFLFMDIVGFTPISEHYKNNDDPEGLVNLINAFLDSMTKVLLAHGATIDKYMGDCIMAFWNAPLACPNHARLCVDAAQKIEIEAKKFNKEILAMGLPGIKVGTGINTGTCIVGNMGSENRFDYSVIGDAVNLAARLEGQTRNYDCDTLIAEHTVKLLGYENFMIMDEIQVKGKVEKVKIYTYKSVD